jgi:hypothetical protein
MSSVSTQSSSPLLPGSEFARVSSGLPWIRRDNMLGKINISLGVHGCEVAGELLAHRFLTIPLARF